jgi:hypothetical protein
MIRSRKILADRINNPVRSVLSSSPALLSGFRVYGGINIRPHSRMQNGSTKNPGIFTIHKICEGFEISLKDFFDTEEFCEMRGDFEEEMQI